MGTKRTKRGAAPARQKPIAAPPPSTKWILDADEVRLFDDGPPTVRTLPIEEPPASSPALERAADAYATRDSQTTMLPPPLPLEALEEPLEEERDTVPPVSYERVKAAPPIAEDERPSDGTLDRLADSFTPSFLDVEEHRASPRVALEVELHVASESHFFSGLSGDISEGGVFVSTYRQLTIGSPVDLEFTLPSSPRPVHARGYVRWHRDASPGFTPGVGIAFEEIDEVDRAAIERFCTTRPPLYYDDVG